MHEERRDDLAAYALGALEPGEAAALECHLAECEGCTEYLHWLQPSVDLLPASVEQLRPPERLGESLMATVRAEAAAAREAAVPQRRRWTIGGLVLRPATGFAAIAVLAVGAVVGYAVSSSGDDRDVVRAEAIGTVPANELVASVEHGAGGDAILHVDRAPAPAEGDVYQVWVSRDGAVEPSASFRPRADGTAEAALGDSLEGADAVLVTEEPTPNEDQPTSAPILRADLG
jgi:hypothetical protein